MKLVKSLFVLVIALFVPMTYAVFDPATPTMSTAVPKGEYLGVYVEIHDNTGSRKIECLPEDGLVEFKYPYPFSGIKKGLVLLLRGSPEGVIDRADKQLSNGEWLTNNGRLVTERNFLAVMTRVISINGMKRIPSSCWGNTPVPEGSVRALSITCGLSMWPEFPACSLNTVIIGYPWDKLHYGPVIYWNVYWGPINHNLVIKWPNNKWTVRGHGVGLKKPMQEVMTPENFVAVTCRVYKKLPKGPDTDLAVLLSPK